MMKSLNVIWDALSKSSESARPIYQRVDEIHPVDFYAGIAPSGARLLFLISPVEPPPVKKYHAFDVSKGRREDGRWTLTIELRRAEFSRLFAHLCEDLIESARADHRPETSAAFVVERISRWQKLLGKDPGELLDDDSIRGLIGELLFLEQVAIPVLGPDLGTRSWEGPLESPQDFRFPERHVEVKTCGTRNLNVWISSAEQLDGSGLPLTLSVAVLEASNEFEEGSFTLRGLVNRIGEFLEGFSPAKRDFVAKIAMTGYADREEYQRNCFVLRRFRHFNVIGDFPRIQRSLIPEALIAARYQLDLIQCAEFEVSTFEFR